MIGSNFKFWSNIKQIYVFPKDKNIHTKYMDNQYVFFRQTQMLLNADQYKFWAFYNLISP